MADKRAIWDQVEFIRRHHAITSPFLYPLPEREACIQLILKEEWVKADAQRAAPTSTPPKVA